MVTLIMKPMEGITQSMKEQLAHQKDMSTALIMIRSITRE